MRRMWGLRLAARSLWRTPAFTGVVVLILGLGIGANATLFSIADAVLFRPFPFVDQQRLVIAGEDGSEPRSEISYRNYLYWRANAETFGDLAVIGSRHCGWGMNEDAVKSKIQNVDRMWTTPRRTQW